MMVGRLTEADLAEIGAAFVGLLGAQAAMGHERPSSTADDYVDPAVLSPMQAVVRDAFALCVASVRPRERQRVAGFVERYDLLRAIGEAVTRG